MGDLYRKINEEGEPRTTAEKELKALLGKEGLHLFNQYFPPEQVLNEVEKAKEWEAWLMENELQKEAELIMSEVSAKSKEQLLYLGGAVNYLEYCRKARKIPDQAKFSDVFSYISEEAKKLASQTAVIGSRNNFELLATLKALIDLKREEFLDENNLLAVIKELNDKFDSLKKAIPDQGDKLK